MKRVLVLLIILTPLTAFVAGCGPSQTPTPPPPKEQQEAMRKAQMEMMQKSSGAQPGAPQPAKK